MCSIATPAARAKLTVKRCGVVPTPVVPKAKLPWRPRATTSASVRGPLFCGVIMTSGARLTMRIGSRSAAA